MCLRLLPSENGNSGILFIGFNQDHGCFAVGLQSGFRIFNSDPLKQLERCDFDVRDGTGVGYVEMLYRTNLLGILGGGNQARLPVNMACLWDDNKQHFLVEMSYASEVKAIRLRRDRIIIVLMNTIKVYTHSLSPQLLHEWETCANPLGLCHVCQSTSRPLAAFPGRRPGTVIIASICETPNATAAPPPRQITAHENALLAITMDLEGRLLATASQKGTLVRIFSTRDCELLAELRRGSNPACITSLAFNPTGELICVTSDHGTAHVFQVPASASNFTASSSTSSSTTGQNKTSTNSKIGPSSRDSSGPSNVNSNSGGKDSCTSLVGKSKPRANSKGSGQHSLLHRYFSSTASQVKCLLETKFKAICAFSLVNPGTLIALAADGSYYKYVFTPNGSVTREAFVNFLDFYEDDADF